METSPFIVNKSMERIRKTFIGKHIDLSKIVAISDARFLDRMGSVGFFVEFEIHVQLTDKPISYVRKFERDEAEYFGESNKRPEPILNKEGKILAVVRLQKQIDELILQWKEVIGDVKKSKTGYSCPDCNKVSSEDSVLYRSEPSLIEDGHYQWEEKHKCECGTIYTYINGD